MAIAGTSVWEMRTSGSNTNGGFYKSDAGTTDYSQQDAAQLALTDLASDGAGTGISSATGGFTAAMVGNGIYITGGTGFTTGWYEITVYTDTNNITIDRSAGASQTGGTGNVGGAVALPVDLLFETFTAGNIMWQKAGTYTLTEALAIAADGTISQPIQIIGYNTTRGDTPAGDNRPLWANGAYYASLGDYWGIQDVRMTSACTSGIIDMNIDGFLLSSKFEHTSTNGGIALLDSDSTGTVVNGCEVIGDSLTSNTIGIYKGAGGQCLGNYVHQLGTNASAYAIYLNTEANAEFNRVSTVQNGIRCNGSRCTVQNNTVYNCTLVGIYAGGGAAKVLNNDINTCGTGISSDTDTERVDFNNYYNNTTDVSNVTKGANATAVNPSYSDASTGDFSNILSVDNSITSMRDINIKQGAHQNAASGEFAYSSVIS